MRELGSHAQNQRLERLAGAARSIAGSLLRDSDRRAERLGEIFLACEAIAAERPIEFDQALESDALEPFLLAHVRDSLHSDVPGAPRGGWLGTYIEADGRDVEAPEDHEDSTDTDALELSGRALTRAVSLAREQGNATMLRNLCWYRERLAHKSYDAIARAEERVPATVRTGVARARKFVLRVVHELRHAQPAPLSGEAPDELQRLRQLWLRQELDALEQELERTRAAYSDDPHWLNVAALFAADRGRHPEAAELYERGLVFADAPEVRGRLLNNLGNLVEDCGRPEDACALWQRAHQLVPNAPAPLLNLLAAASSEQDYPSAQHHLSQLSDLLNADRLSPEERDYVRRRLQDHPRLAWLRETDAWRVGPSRWLRSWGRGLLVLVASGVLALWFQPLAAQASSPTGSAMELSTQRSAPISLDISPQKKGGDSMGKPRKRFEAPLLVAGDSMPRTGRPVRKGRPPR